MTYPNGREPVENTVHHADTFRELQLDRSTVRSVEESIAEAMQKIGHSTDGTLNADTTDTSS